MHTVHSLSLLTTHSLILLAIRYSCWEASYWQEYLIKPPDIRGCGISVIWALTSLLVATLLKLMLKLSAFGDSCKSFPFLCNTSMKCTVTWLLRCKYYTPICWFLVSHQVFYLHPMQVGGLSTADRYFSQKNTLTNIMSGESMLIIHHCRMVLLDAVQ